MIKNRATAYVLLALLTEGKPMFINPKPLGWLAAGAISGLFFALATKSYWGHLTFSLVVIVIAATYLYAWMNPPRRPVQ